jgi:hypothetical protein
MKPANFPEDLPHHKRQSMQRVRKVSHLLDEAFRIPGTQFRVGLDPILGLLPVGGDLASALISLYIAFEGYRMEVPRHVLARMLANVAIDTFVGSVPVLGSIFDATWKANRKNRSLLERHIDRY